jgi:phosphoacetylglucosamine mutase
VDAPAAGVAGVLAGVAAAEGVAWPPPEGAATVYVARDTRPSSAHLAGLVATGAATLGAKVVDHGLLTTPQLHYIVRQTNAGPAGAVGAPTEDGYYATLARAYADVLAGTPPNAAGRGPLHLDCAQGVGGPKAARLAAAMAGLVEVVPRNTGATPAEAALLNEGCGAEHCQKARLPPSGFSVAAGDAGRRLASLDGDADRLVYHYFDGASGEWRLLDGDKIATLAALFVADQLRDLGLPLTAEATHGDHAVAVAPPVGGVAPVSVGVVQTAYANGASTAYIRDVLRLPVPLARTGVKFVHHAATGYDVGVYFEANGHGTVLLHAAFLERLAGMDAGALSPAAATARARLLAASRLINQAIGDALSDAMFVEAVLALKGWSVQAWDALYADLPSRQTKLAVADRTAFVPVDDETRLVAPAPLQAAIDALVAAVPSGRAFVRPSGTEDVVRVYAEAATQAAADALAAAVAGAAHRLGGGVGAPPTAMVA